MKSIVRILTVFFAVFCMIVSFASCGENGGNTDGNGTTEYADYTVTVTDAIGTPMSNVLVKFTGSDGETKTRVTGKDGLAVLKNALVGKYNVVVEKGFSDAEIIDSTFEMTAENKSLRVIVFNPEKAIEISGAVDEGTYAYGVADSEYNVIGKPGAMSYYVFNASVKGIYKFSFASEDSDMTIGFYGIPMFVQDHHIGDSAYDGTSFEITVQDVATPYVIGLNFVNTSDARLIIQRIGDAPFDPSHAEWDEVQAPENLTKCDTSGKKLSDIDIESKNVSVSLGDDGYYYTNTGKKVYVRITTSSKKYGNYVEGKFVPIIDSLAFLAGYVDNNVGMNIGGYIYDGEGNFVCKKRCNEVIKTYMDYVDDTYGVVPLTEELAECIKLFGDSKGWWDSSSSGYMFDGIPVNAENAWLIFCMAES